MPTSIQALPIKLTKFSLIQKQELFTCWSSLIPVGLVYTFVFAHEVLDEGVTDPEFAMEMLEMNEEIEETNDRKILEEKLEMTQKRVDEFLEQIAKNFEQGKNEEARDALNRMRYFERTVKLIKKKLGH